MFFYVGVLYDVIVGRIQAVREDTEKDRGASAIEWAIIAALSVAMAVIIGVVVYNVVNTQKGNISNCANVKPGDSC
jgi:Flp pilus assembly pilin Flp